MSDFENWFKSLNENGRVTYFLGQEGRISEEAWNHQQAKIDELQKQVDAVKQLIEEYRDPPTEDKTFQHALSIVADELEQALKGGEE